jgi:hypothetical protein
MLAMTGQAYAQKICKEDYDRCREQYSRGTADGSVDEFLTNYMNRCLGVNPVIAGVVDCKRPAPAPAATLPSAASSSSQQKTAQAPIKAATHPAAKLPMLKKGVDYAEARKQILAQGWQPIKLPSAEGCLSSDNRCDGRPEAFLCATAGRLACRFTWKRGEVIADVVTVGEGGTYIDAVLCRTGCDGGPAVLTAPMPYEKPVTPPAAAQNESLQRQATQQSPMQQAASGSNQENRTTCNRELRENPENPVPDTSYGIAFTNDCATPRSGIQSQGVADQSAQLRYDASRVINSPVAREPAPGQAEQESQRNAQTATAQSLPNEAWQILLKEVELHACQKIPLGQFFWSYDQQTRRPIYLAGDSDKDSFFLASSYEKIGLVGLDVVKVSGGQFGFSYKATVQVRLKYPLDGKVLRQNGKDVCYQLSDFANASGKVNRTEPTKGGRTNWAGVVAYVELLGIGCLTPPPSFPNICRNDPNKPRQFRALFREKPFDGSWRLVAYDIYLKEQNHFMTNNVIDALQAD